MYLHLIAMALAIAPSFRQERGMVTASTAEQRPFLMGGREFIILMALLQALQALAIDSMLPALGVMSQDLGAHDANQRQLIVGVFLICSGIGALFPGALADRFGRKPVLLICLAGYVIFSLAAALMQDFTALLIMRGAAGLVSAGMIVMSSTIIRDRFQGDRMARMQSLVAMVFMIVPMVAPSLGQAVLLFADWRWIFGIMAALGVILIAWVVLRLPETLHPEFRQPVEVRVISRNMWTALTTRASFGYVFGMALVQGALFGYINSSQQLVAEHFGAGEKFPLIFGAMALMMACANLTNSRIVERFGARRVSHTALLCFMLMGAVQLWLALRGGETLLEFSVVMTLNMCLMGFIGANFASIALQPFARIAGAAASLQTFIRLALGSALGAVIGQLYDGSATPLAGALVFAGAGGLLLVLFSERGTLFQRRHGMVPQA